MLKNKNFDSFLEFTLDYDAPDNFIEQWEKMRHELYNNDIESKNNTQLFELLKSNCKISSNKNLPILDRCEWGIGGNDNSKNKQLRIKNTIADYHLSCSDRCLPIRIDYFDSDDKKTELWTNEELTDLIKSFIKSFSHILNSISTGTANCCEGSIVYKCNDDFDE